MTKFINLIDNIVNAIKNMSLFKNAEEKALEAEASHLLELGSYQLFFAMVESGYKATYEQTEYLKEKANSFIESSKDRQEDDSKRLEELLLAGYQMEKETISNLFFNFSFIIYARRNLAEKRPYSNYQNKEGKSYYWAEASKQVLKAMENPSIAEYLFKVWLVKLEGNRNSRYLHTSDFEYQWDVMKEDWTPLVTSEVYKNIMKTLKIKESFGGNTFLLNFEEHFKDLNEKDTQKLIERTKKHYRAKESEGQDGDNKLGNNVDKMLSHAPAKKVGQLVGEPKIIVSKIEANLKEINLSLLDSQEGFTIKNISQVVLMETIDKYLSIDEKYRVEMRNADGKNAYDLMLESLKNIQSVVETIAQKQRVKGLDELTTHTNYTRHLKASK